MKRKSDTPSGVGRHGPRQGLSSSTTKEKKARSGYLVCSQCLAEYHEKHWYSTDSSLEAPDRVRMESICPGCYRVEKRIWNGEVIIEGLDKFASRSELTSLLKRVEHECWLDNPTSRILGTIETEDKLEIKTTTAWLARRLGKEVESAFRGHLEINELTDKEMLYIHWYLDNDESFI